MKKMSKKWNGHTMDITVTEGNTAWQFVACFNEKTNSWSTFGYVYTEDDEDNLPSFRKDEVGDDEVGEMISRFEKEYGPKIAR